MLIGLDIDIYDFIAINTTEETWKSSDTSKAHYGTPMIEWDETS